MIINNGHSILPLYLEGSNLLGHNEYRAWYTICQIYFNCFFVVRYPGCSGFRFYAFLETTSDICSLKNKESLGFSK